MRDPVSRPDRVSNEGSGTTRAGERAFRNRLVLSWDLNARVKPDRG